MIGVEPPELGYCHRGIRNLVDGKAPNAALPIIERACSRAHEAYRIAACQALESASTVAIGEAAATTRVLFAEIERMLARLWTLALAARAASSTSLYRQALDQRESLFAALEASTGKRHYWAVTVPGGVRSDLELAPLQEALTDLEPRLGAWKAAVAPTGVIGRVGNQVGAISTDQAQTIGLTGLAARGSGVENDLRIAKPYAAYGQYQVQLLGEEAEEERRGLEGGRKAAGDVTSRLTAAAADLVSSHSIAQAAISQLTTEPDEASKGAEKLTVPAESSQVTSSVECPHGPISMTFQFKNDGVISGLELETPGAILVEALPQLLEGRLLPQVPLILASLDLCIECLDQ